MTPKEIYLDHCLRHQVPLFFQAAWLDASGIPWDVRHANSKGYVAFWIYHRYTKLGFSFMRNPHLTPYTGILFTNPFTPEDIAQELTDLLLQQLPDVDVLEIDLGILPYSAIQFQTFKTSMKHTNLLHLDDEKKIFENFKPALKRQIRKAERLLTIDESDDIVLMYDLHKKTFEKQGERPHIPESAFNRYWECCRRNETGRIFFIRDENHSVHAALWLAFDEQQSYYLAGGTDHRFYGSGAMSLLMWHAIRESCRMGKHKFDFEGSMLANVDRFFKNFAPVEFAYTHLKKIESKIYKLLKQKD